MKKSKYSLVVLVTLICLLANLGHSSQENGIPIYSAKGRGGGDLNSAVALEMKSYINTYSKSTIYEFLIGISMFDFPSNDNYVKLKKMINAGLMKNIKRTTYSIKPACFDSFGAIKDASTKRINLFKNPLQEPPEICLNLKSLSSKKASYADITSLLLHEHARHYGYEDENKYGYHPIAAFAGQMNIGSNHLHNSLGFSLSDVLNPEKALKKFSFLGSNTALKYTEWLTGGFAGDFPFYRNSYLDLSSRLSIYKMSSHEEESDAELESLMSLAIISPTAACKNKFRVQVLDLDEIGSRIGAGLLKRPYGFETNANSFFTVIKSRFTKQSSRYVYIKNKSKNCAFKISIKDIFGKVIETGQYLAQSDTKSSVTYKEVGIGISYMKIPFNDSDE